MTEGDFSHSPKKNLTMINGLNFGSDEFKKQVLESEGLSPTPVTDSYEELPVGDPLDFIGSTPVIPGTSGGVRNIIRDASALEKSGNLEKAESINAGLVEIISDYNRKYGTSLEVDFGDISRTLVSVSDPKKTRVLELYLSQVFQSIRPVIYLHMLSKLAMMVDYVLDPQRLTDGTLTYADQFVCIEKILAYIQTIESLKDEILIKGAEVELQKLGETEAGPDSGFSEGDRETIDEFMKLFRKDSGMP
nr:MAG TPA: hypothetical protein [Caudoviricetes sp.]